MLQTVTLQFQYFWVLDLRENLREYSAGKYILFIVDIKKKKGKKKQLKLRIGLIGNMLFSLVGNQNRKQRTAPQPTPLTPPTPHRGRTSTHVPVLQHLRNFRSSLRSF